MDKNDETKSDETKESSNKRVFLTESGQVDSDFALAMALQEQERALVTLTMSESEEDEDDIEDDDDDEDGDFFEDDAFSDIFEDEDENHELEDMEEELSEDSLEMEDDDVDPDEMSYEELIALEEVVGTENKGLSPNELPNYLYPHIYKSQFDCKQSQAFDQCVICQFEYQQGEPVVALSCKHIYHSECITKWLQINKICPICNAEIATFASWTD